MTNKNKLPVLDPTQKVWKLSEQEQTQLHASLAVYKLTYSLGGGEALKTALTETAIETVRTLHMYKVRRAVYETLARDADCPVHDLAAKLVELLDRIETGAFGVELFAKVLGVHSKEFAQIEEAVAQALGKYIVEQTEQDESLFRGGDHGTRAHGRYGQDPNFLESLGLMLRMKDKNSNPGEDHGSNA